MAQSAITQLAAGSEQQAALKKESGVRSQNSGGKRQRSEVRYITVGALQR